MAHLSKRRVRNLLEKLEIGDSSTHLQSDTAIDLANVLKRFMTIELAQDKLVKLLLFIENPHSWSEISRYMNDPNFSEKIKRLTENGMVIKTNEKRGNWRWSRTGTIKFLRAAFQFSTDSEQKFILFQLNAETLSQFRLFGEIFEEPSLQVLWDKISILIALNEDEISVSNVLDVNITDFYGFVYYLAATNNTQALDFLLTMFKTDFTNKTAFEQSLSLWKKYLVSDTQKPFLRWVVNPD